MKFLIKSQPGLPTRSSEDANSQSQPFLIIPKTNSIYPQAYKKWFEAKGNKSHRLNHDNSSFFKDIWRIHGKKIEKNATFRRPLANISNLQHINKPFIEDAIKANNSRTITNNYEVLSYMSSQSKNLMLFRCFDEKDLKIPDEFAGKTISHTLDNDASTDEEQVKNAIGNLQNSIKERIEKKAIDNKEKQKKIIIIR